MPTTIPATAPDDNPFEPGFADAEDLPPLEEADGDRKDDLSS